MNRSAAPSIPPLRKEVTWLIWIVAAAGRGPPLGGRLQRGCRFCFAGNGGEATTSRLAEWLRPELVYAGRRPPRCRWSTTLARLRSIGAKRIRRIGRSELVAIGWQRDGVAIQKLWREKFGRKGGADSCQVRPVESTAADRDVWIIPLLGPVECPRNFALKGHELV